MPAATLTVGNTEITAILDVDTAILSPRSSTGVATLRQTDRIPCREVSGGLHRRRVALPRPLLPGPHADAPDLDRRGHRPGRLGLRTMARRRGRPAGRTGGARRAPERRRRRHPHPRALGPHRVGHDRLVERMGPAVPERRVPPSWGRRRMDAKVRRRGGRPGIRRGDRSPRVAGQLDTSGEDREVSSGVGRGTRPVTPPDTGASCWTPAASGCSSPGTSCTSRSS